MRLLLAPLFALALAQSDRFALRGFDPVLLGSGEERPGLDELVETWGRYTYRFGSEETRDRFLAEPARWAIQWDGACGRMGPLSGRGDKDRWTVHDGRIYIFASDQCRDGFLSAPDRFVPAPPRRAAPSDAHVAIGRSWIRKSLEAHGGAMAIDERFAAIRLTRTSEIGDWRHDQELLVSTAGAVRSRSTWTSSNPDEKGFDTVLVLGQDAFSVENGVVHEMQSPAAHEDVRRFGLREVVGLLWATNLKGARAVSRGEGRLGETNVVNVDVHALGLVTTLHLERQSGRILGVSWRGRPGDGVTRDVVETFDEWRTIEGIVIPMGRSVTADGEEKPSFSKSWDTVELLDTVPDGAFTRPNK